MSPCTQEDDFTREQRLSRARWFVRLSDGVVVIQDDDRPGEPLSAWLRLGQHLAKTGLSILALWVQFRDEPPVSLPAGAAGYFFRWKVGALLDSEASFHYYLLGYLENNQVVVHEYQVPELVLLGTSLRDPGDPLGVGPSLLRNP